MICVADPQSGDKLCLGCVDRLIRLVFTVHRDKIRWDAAITSSLAFVFEFYI